MDKSKWNKTTATYFPKSNRVRIKAKSTEFYPQYLKYLFEYLKIPTKATIIFNDKTIEGGLDAWLSKE